MKKIILTISLLTILLITGCGKLDEQEIKNNFIKETENLKSYYLEGTMTLTNNDDIYNYDVEASYEKDDKYKVKLTNKSNNYEQIILKNNDGVYVITPSLNKSFKFQSNWPNNNSQVYLIDSIAKDLKNTSEPIFEMKDNDYVWQINANYPNNPQITSQKITLDKNYDLKKVEVLNKDNISLITFTIKNLDKKATFNNDYFEIETITKDFINEETKDNKDKNQTETKTEETISIDEALFPLYIPTNTSLSDREVINIDNGQRVIMTFSGENPFILVQETVKKEEELTIIPTYGEPYLLIDTVGSLTDMSYTWTSNGIEYYIVSDVLNQNELLEIAKSINVVATLSEK